jgi:accessory gene regulator B
MIKALAQRIAKTMGAQLQADRDKVEIFTYGLEIILGTLLQLTFLILLSLFMDTFVTTMICMIAFASLRYFGGGIHLSTYYGCLIVGVTLLLALGKLATVDISLEALIVISIVAFLMGTFTIFRWVPAETEKKQINDEAARLRQRKKALLILIMWFATTQLLITKKLTANAFAAVLGILGSLFLITPWGYRAVKALDNILNITLKGCRRCLEK